MAGTDESINIGKLMKSVANLKEMCDGILTAGDNIEKFPAHRLILIASSKYFGALLGPKFSEEAEKEIPLKQTDGPTLKTILDFIYSGHIEITDDNIDNIIAAASTMKLIAIEEKCGQFWKAKLSIESCANILRSADKYTLKDLWSETLNFICDNFEALRIADIQQIDEKNLNEVLKQDKVTAPETIVFDRLAQWIAKNQGESVTVVSNLLELIRLEFIPTKTLIEVIEPLYKKYDCVDVVVNEYRKRLLDPRAVCLHRYAPMAIYCSIHTSTTEVSVQKYDSNENKWTAFKNIPLGLQRSSPGSIFFNGELFVMGGSSNNIYLNSVESYNLDDLTKTILPNMATFRAVFTPISVGKYIYAFGGGNNGSLDACERFDTEKRVWNALQKMPNPTSSYAIEQINGQIYIAGGTSSSGKYSTHFYCYYPKTNSWSEKSCMPYQECITPALAKTSQFLYAMQSNGMTHQYEPERDIWTTIGSFGNTLTIKRTIKHYDQMYALCNDGKFVILNMEVYNTFDPLDEITLKSTDLVHLFIK